MKVVRGIREGFQFHYPQSRREVAYRRGVETSVHVGTKYGWALFATLLFWSADGVVNLMAIVRAVLGFKPLVIAGIVVGVLVLALSSGCASFRRWAGNPDLVATETRPRGRPPKKSV